MGKSFSFLTRAPGFAVLPLVSALIPMLVLPFVSRVGGSAAWTAYGVGISIGNLVISMTGFGWNLTGPARLARAANSKERGEVFRASTQVQLSLLLVSLPPAMIAAWLLAPSGSRYLATVVSISTGLGGLSIGWFGIGVGSPGIIAFYEVVPRVLASLLSVPLMMLTGQVVFYPLALVVATVCGRLAFRKRVFGSISLAPPAYGSVISEIRAGVGAGGSVTLNNAYNSATIPISSVLFSADLAAGITSADKLYRYAMIPISVLCDSLQAWVLDRDAVDPERRQRVVLGLCCGAGAIGAAVLFLVGAKMTVWLFGAGVGAEPNVVRWYAVALISWSIVMPFERNRVVPSGLGRVALLGNAVGMAVGLVVMYSAGRSMGPAGVALGLAVAEVARTGVEVFVKAAMNRKSRT